MVRFGMGRDDWKYDEDAWNEMEDEGKKGPPRPRPWCNPTFSYDRRENRT